MAKIESKQIVIDEIKANLANATSVVLIDARGINVDADTKLRKTLRENGVVYKVYKNSMIDFAIKGTEFEGLKDELKGPTTLAISYEDPTLAARLISKEAQSIPSIEFKAGIVDGVFYDAAGIKMIATIPSKEVLLSKLLGSIKSPISSFARVIKAIAEKQDEVA